MTLLDPLELIYSVYQYKDNIFLTLLVNLASIYCVPHSIKNILLTLHVLVASIYCVSHTAALLPELVNGSCLVIAPGKPVQGQLGIILLSQLKGRGRTSP